MTLQASAFALENDAGRGEILVLDMGKPVKIIDLARRMVRMSGLCPDRDVGIEIIGLRPGEKLHEELFDTLETRRPSGLDGVLMAASAEVSLREMSRAVSRLEACARIGEERVALKTLRKHVPGYHQGLSKQTAAFQAASERISEGTEAANAPQSTDQFRGSEAAALRQSPQV